MHTHNTLIDSIFDTRHHPTFTMVNFSTSKIWHLLVIMKNMVFAMIFA